jgi:hypothetical protein
MHKAWFSATSLGVEYTAWKGDVWAHTDTTLILGACMVFHFCICFCDARGVAYHRIGLVHIFPFAISSRSKASSPCSAGLGYGRVVGRDGVISVLHCMGVGAEAGGGATISIRAHSLAGLVIYLFAC